MISKTLVSLAQVSMIQEDGKAVSAAVGYSTGAVLGYGTVGGYGAEGGAILGYGGGQPSL